MYVSEADRIARRAERIASWFDYLDATYGELLSRPEETASLSGWDDKPRERPCECRAAWQRGPWTKDGHGLCLACDNTGWRRAAAGEEGIDPYSAQVEGRRSFLLVESDSARQTKAQHQMDSTISVLERNGLIRDGLEIAEGNEARVFRMIGTKQTTLVKILHALALLLQIDSECVRRASRDALARALAHLVPGRLYPAPA